MLLGDVEVLHVEETVLAYALDQRLRELLLSFGSTKETEVQSNQISPVEILLHQKIQL